MAEVSGSGGSESKWKIDRKTEAEHNQQQSGSSSAVERQLPKLDVAGSIPVSRSIIQ